TPEIDDKEETPGGEVDEATTAEEKAEKKEKAAKETEDEALDDVAEKLLQAEEAREVVEGLYRQFLGLRLGREWEKTELPRMREWVSLKLDKAAALVGLR